MNDAPTVTSHPIPAGVRETISRLTPGQRIRVTQTVRVGLKSWPVVVEGVFRQTSALVTGLSTERDPRDDIIVATIHFTKDNGELSSIAVDENTKVEPIAPGSPSSLEMDFP